MSTEVRASYTDSFGHAFDAKGRITVPSEWRQPTFEASLFVLPSSEACVRVYPGSWLSEIQEKLKILKDGDPVRRQVQTLASIAQSTTWDQQGRIMVKEKLRQRAGLKKEAVLVGLLTHFEIWDKTVWEKRQVTEPTVEEALSAIGL
jgi:MraZ protein